MNADLKKMDVPAVKGLTAHLQAADLFAYFIDHTLLPSCRTDCKCMEWDTVVQL